MKTADIKAVLETLKMNPALFLLVFMVQHSANLKNPLEFKAEDVKDYIKITGDSLETYIEGDYDFIPAESILMISLNETSWYKD